MAFVDTGDYNQKDPTFASHHAERKIPYGVVRTASMLHDCEIDPEKGMLTGIGKWQTEKAPRGFNIDPR